MAAGTRGGRIDQARGKIKELEGRLLKLEGQLKVLQGQTRQARGTARVRLARLEKKLSERKRVVDTFGALFARPIGPDLLGMATGEALAHLNCLIRRGRAKREVDGDGVAWYAANSSDA